MKQAEHPNQKRQMWIEHIFRAANHVPVRQQRSRQINDVEALKDQQPRRLRGENKRRLQPQPNPNQDISQITKE